MSALSSTVTENETVFYQIIIIIMRQLKPKHRMEIGWTKTSISHKKSNTIAID